MTPQGFGTQTGRESLPAQASTPMGGRMSTVQVKGLAEIADANRRSMEGLANHLREMGAGHDDALRKAQECSRMCGEVAALLRE